LTQTTISKFLFDIEAAFNSMERMNHDAQRNVLQGRQDNDTQAASKPKEEYKESSGSISQETKEKFQKCVSLAGPDDCWLWTKGKFKSGYGSFNLNGFPARAHRVSFMIYYGSEIPDGMNVCHKCDVPDCVNPNHLFLGTRSDNMRDKEKKGRGNHTRGELNHSKLKEEQVRAIRNEFAKGGITKHSLAVKYGVADVCIRKIIKREKWAHVF
jgi:hypothetical protein